MRRAKLFTLVLIGPCAGCALSPGGEPPAAPTASLGSASAPARAPFTQLVDPFIGVDNDGMTLPGPYLPFSLAKPGPDGPTPNWTTGYRSDRPIDGFSQNHVSGTGGPGRFGNFLVVPQTGPITISQYSSPKGYESAAPGYYAVFLSRWQVRAELTTEARVSHHRFTFPAAAGEGHLLIDASRIIQPNWEDFFQPRVLGAEMRITPEGQIEGAGHFVGGWGHGHPYDVYIAAELDAPPSGLGVFRDGQLIASAREVSGREVGVYLTFDLARHNPIHLRVGLSYTSVEQARKHLAQSIGWDFDEVAARAERTWSEVLGRIEVTGGSAEQRRLFYTSLYRSFAMPTEVTGDNPRWTSASPQYWDYYCIWDTFRTLHPLLTLIAPDKQVEMLQSLLDIYDHLGWVPDAFIVGYPAAIQGGTNSDVLFADALLKKLPGIDYEKAYRAMVKNAEEPTPDPGGLGRKNEQYNRLGYCSSDVRCGSSLTLEYAYDDFCISEVAEVLGKEADAQKYRRRSQNAFHLFMDDTHFFWAKDPQGNWAEGFSPTFITDRPYEGPYFYEGTPWHYATYVPHDVQGLIQRHGGDDAFVAFLDTMFDQGHYTHSNEPDILTPYLYIYAGRPDRTAERVRAILNNDYHATPGGLPGNDDAGCMSSWYVFSAMGFYPNAGQDLYLIGSPLFERSVVHLGQGKTLTIEAPGTSEQNRYVQSATLNGNPWDQAWFRHTDIGGGATLILTMGETPSPAWGTRKRPPSVTPAP